MTELAYKVLKDFGLPTLIAVGLGGLLVYTTMQASKERIDHTQILIDQIYELTERVAKLEGLCTK
jgi:hypothetical protein